MNATTLFRETIPSLLVSRSALFKRNVVCAFKIVGEGGGEWTLDLHADPPSCREGLSPNAFCTVEMSHDRFVAVLEDHRLLIDYYYQNKVVVSGDYRIYFQLRELLSLIVKSPRADIGLAHLLAPFDARRFLEHHWPNTHLVVHGSPDRLEGLTDIPQLQSAHALLDSWPGFASVFPPKSGDEYDAPVMSAKEAAVFFDRGYAVSITGVEAHIPALKSYLAKLITDLRMPASVYGRCICYLTPARAGASPHFDQNANFIVQLTGEKIWQLAANKSIQNPSTRHVMSSPEPFVELLYQATDPFPTTMPEWAETISLKPGSVLFLPNAYWHTTSSNAASLSLNFTFDQPSWADLVTEALRRLLIMDHPWRELATGSNPTLDANVKKLAIDRLQELLKDIPNVVELLNPAQIVNMPPKPRPSTADVDLRRSWVQTLLGEDSSS